MDKFEIQMKEYEALRQEIREIQGRRDQLFLFSIAAFGIIWGFILKENGVSFIIVSFVPYFIVFNICHLHRRFSRSIIKIGTYICNFIESNYKGVIQWERVSDEFTGESTKEKPSGGYWYLFYYAASIGNCFGVICLDLLSDKLKPLGFSRFKDLKSGVANSTFALVHLVICCCCIMKGVQKLHLWKLNTKERKSWNEHWRSIKKESNNV